MVQNKLTTYVLNQGGSLVANVGLLDEVIYAYLVDFSIEETENKLVSDFYKVQAPGSQIACSLLESCRCLGPV